MQGAMLNRAVWSWPGEQRRAALSVRAAGESLSLVRELVLREEQVCISKEGKTVVSAEAGARPLRLDKDEGVQGGAVCWSRWGKLRLLRGIRRGLGLGVQSALFAQAQAMDSF